MKNGKDGFKNVELWNISYDMKIDVNRLIWGLLERQAIRMNPNRPV